MGNDICSCSGRVGELAQGEIGFQSVESPCLLHDWCGLSSRRVEGGEDVIGTLICGVVQLFGAGSLVGNPRPQPHASPELLLGKCGLI